MFSLFRRLRRSIIGSGETASLSSPVGKYLFYAIGEFILIVTGILMALQISNWNTDKINRAQEQNILEELEATLRVDLEQFKSKLQLAQLSAQRIKLLQKAIHSEQKVDSLNILCGAVFGMHIFNLNTASFEELKSNGFDLIKDDSIRVLIIQIYDTHLKYIETTNLIEQNVTFEAVRPYYLSHFTNIEFLNNATPKDAKMIYVDDYYHNLIDYRLKALTFNQLGYYPIVLDDIIELLERIDRYLE